MSGNFFVLNNINTLLHVNDWKITLPGCDIGLPPPLVRSDISIEEQKIVYKKYYRNEYRKVPSNRIGDPTLKFDDCIILTDDESSLIHV